MAQQVETATDNKHTHKDLGLITVNVYGFVYTNTQTNTQTHGRYQTYYLPCFAVDNDCPYIIIQVPILNHVGFRVVIDRHTHRANFVTSTADAGGKKQLA